MAKNIIVSNRLPIQLTKLDNSFEFVPTSGGLATGMNSVHKGQESLWIGWPGIDNDDIDKKTWAPLLQEFAKMDLNGKDEKEIVNQLEALMNSEAGKSIFQQQVGNGGSNLP